jgi:alkyl hydroperoxide reductase subunit AhpC
MTIDLDLSEVLRVLDSLQLKARHSVVTPVNNVIIVTTVCDEEAKKFPNGRKAPKPYLRIAPQRRA